MKRLPVACLALLASCGGSTEENAAKDRAAAAATWALVLRIDGADARVPLEVMNVLLLKDEDEAKATPAVFEVRGSGVSLIGEIPAASSPGYGEKWEKTVAATLTIKASGEFHGEGIDSKMMLPGKPEAAIMGGTMTVEGTSGKWAGSQGDRTLKGKVRLQMRDGQVLEGTFAVHAVTWG